MGTLIMPEALGKECLDLVWEWVCRPSASPSLAAGSHSPQTERLLSAPLWGAPFPTPD